MGDLRALLLPEKLAAAGVDGADVLGHELGDVFVISASPHLEPADDLAGRIACPVERLADDQEQLPLAGGFDKNGTLTNDPAAILESGRALPIGYWKGSGLALVLDLLASIVADGDSTGKISERKHETGVSQVFLAIDVESRMEAAGIDEKVNAILEDFIDIQQIEGAPMVHYPGQGMMAERRRNMKDGIPVERVLWQMIQML